MLVVFLQTLRQCLPIIHFPKLIEQHLKTRNDIKNNKADVFRCEKVYLKPKFIVYL